ncbi:MAG: glycosyltransferase family 39 protein [Candidatus Omnitrophica bacterium]|nr:glycosyltransferase family 39 protein [Candidatus Omnitrophota bacterium]
MISLDDRKFEILQNTIYLILVFIAFSLFIIPLNILQNKIILPLAHLLYSTHRVMQPDTLILLKNALIKFRHLFLITVFFGGLLLALRRLLLFRLPLLNLQKSSILPSNIKLYECFFLGLIGIIALLLRWQGMGRELYYDEIYTLFNFVQKGTVWSSFFNLGSLNNHIGFSLLARLSVFLFGPAEWALRLPSLIIGMCSLILFWIFVRRLLTAHVAIVALFLMAIFPIHVMASVSARGYTGMVFFTILSTYLFWHLIRCPGSKYSTAYVIANFLGVLFHFYFLTVIAAQGLMMMGMCLYQIVLRPKEPVIGRNAFTNIWKCFFITILCLILFCAFIGSRLLVETLGGTGAPPRAGGSILPHLWDYFTQGWDSCWTKIIVFMFLLIGFISLWKKKRFLCFYAVVLLLVPMSLIALFITGERFFVFFVPFFILILTQGMAEIWNIRNVFSDRWLRYVYSFGVIFIFLNLTVGLAQKDLVAAHENEGFRYAVRIVGEHANRQTAMCAIGDLSAILVYYARYYSNYDVSLPKSTDEFYRLVSGAKTIYCFQFSKGNLTSKENNIAEYFRQKGTYSFFGRLKLFEIHV